MTRFNTLDKRLVGSATGWGSVGTKILLDQALLSPTVHAFFFPYMAVAEGAAVPQVCIDTTDLGGTIEQGVERFQNNFVQLMSTSYCFWPFVHTITFKYVPLHHRCAACADQTDTVQGRVRQLLCHDVDGNPVTLKHSSP